MYIYISIFTFIHIHTIHPAALPALPTPFLHYIAVHKKEHKL